MNTSLQRLPLIALCLAAACADAKKGSSSDTTNTDGTTTATTGGGVVETTTTGSTTAGLTTAGTTTATTGGTTGGTLGAVLANGVVNKTSQVTVSGAAGAASTALPYALVRTATTPSTPAKKYTLAISSYSFCGWGLRDNYMGHPNTATILAMYLQNQTAGTIIAPAAGTYNISTPAAGATGMFIDPVISAEESFKGSCTGTYPTYTSGTVTITAVDATGNLTGSLNIVLSDGTTASGTFTTATCKGNEADGTDETPTECTW